MKPPKHFSFCVLPLLLSFLNIGPLALADQLVASGYSVNNGPRPLYKINLANGSIDQTITTIFQPPGYGNDVGNLGFAYGDGYLWALGYSVNNGQRPLYKINPANGAIVQTIITPFRPLGYGNDVITLSLAYGNGYLWALGYSVNNGPRPLYKISPVGGGIVQTLTTPFQPPGYGNDVALFGMAYGGGYLSTLGYSINNGPRPLYKINPATGAIAQTFTTPFKPPGYGNDVASFGLAYGNGYLWAFGYSVNNGPRPTIGPGGIGLGVRSKGSSGIRPW